MGAETGIEWTDSTVNFVIGCTKVDELCANCYADSMDDRRFSKTLPGTSKAAPVRHWGPNAARYLRIEKAVEELKALERKAQKAGTPRKVFINSLSDTFEGRPDLNHARSVLFWAIHHCPNLIFQLLTKRPENVVRMVPFEWLNDWPHNVWMGASYSPERVVELLKIPARVRFLSCEPLLGPVRLNSVPYKEKIQSDDTWTLMCNPLTGWRATSPFSGSDDGPRIHWIICGGESGPKARPMQVEWAQSLHDQCVSAGVAFFMKQGSQANWPDFKNIESFPKTLQRREFPCAIS